MNKIIIFFISAISSSDSSYSQCQFCLGKTIDRRNWLLILNYLQTGNSKDVLNGKIIYF